MTTTRQARSLTFAGSGLPKFLRLERAYLDEKDKLEISTRLKDARVRAGYDERTFGELLDPPVSDRSIRNYEAGRVPFRFLRQWAKITQVDYEYLLHGELPPPVPVAEVMHLEEMLAQVADMVARGFEALGVAPQLLEGTPDFPPPTEGAQEKKPRKRGQG